jgi:hypothetical protein
MRRVALLKGVFATIFCAILIFAALHLRSAEPPPQEDNALVDVLGRPSTQSSSHDESVSKKMNSDEEASEHRIERASIPAPVVAQKRHAHEFPIEGAKLPVLQWSFRKYAGTAVDLLDNPSFNPSRLSLEPSKLRLLEGMLDEIVRDESAFANEYNGSRHAHAAARLRSNRFELAPETARDTPTILVPKHAEQEVVAASSSVYGSGIVRIEWGDDPELDRERLKIIDFKIVSAERIKEFIVKNGK